MVYSRPNAPFLDAADAIGARLCRDAIWASSRCNWLGASMEIVGGRWQVAQRTFGPDLYSGTSGIALFLGQLYQFVPESIYRVTAIAAMRHAFSRLEDTPPMAQISFYSGYTGMAYIAHRLGDLLDEPTLREQTQRLLDRLADVDLNSQGIDLLNGIAGAIPTLLHLGREHRRQDLLDRAALYGEKLLGTARRTSFGWSWSTMGRTSEASHSEIPDLLGFSHGTAGIGWALLELYLETRDRRFLEGTEQAFAYERHFFDAEQQNWPDFRPLHESTAASKREPASMVAWCHGAPGIGLARLRAYESLGDDMYRSEATLAIQTTTRAIEHSLSNGQVSFCLCHGLAGNSDLFLYADRVLKDAGCRQLAEQVGRYGMEHYHAAQAPWPCGVLGGGETPGLFLGLAGIGYFYLRLYQSDLVPPITIPLPVRSLMMTKEGKS